MKDWKSYAGYFTDYGSCVCGNSLQLLDEIDDESIDLVFTSPPFALQRKKEYGNENQNEYIKWLCEFGKKIFRVLKSSGSFVIDIGGAYEKGSPSYSLYQFKVLITLCEEIGFILAQPFYWHNPCALPAPIEWVNKKKLRAKNSVNTLWWLCKTPECKADITQVLTPYSSRMEKLLNNPGNFVKGEGTERPSGHILGQASWTKNNGGSIPSNLLQISNTESNSQYLRYCRAIGIKGHPARFPSELPKFFIKFLTTENDIILDIFAGSNTTGYIAEKLGRRWLSFEIIKEYTAGSVLRFADSKETAENYYEAILRGEYVKISERQLMMFTG